MAATKNLAGCTQEQLYLHVRAMLFHSGLVNDVPRFPESWLMSQSGEEGRVMFIFFVFCTMPSPHTPNGTFNHFMFLLTYQVLVKKSKLLFVQVLSLSNFHIKAKILKLNKYF